MNDLVLTRDLDVLEATLRLSLKFSLLYKRSDPVAGERLLALTQGWNTREHGINMVDLVKPDLEIPQELLHVKFEYYRQVPLGVSSLVNTPARTDTPTAQSPSTPRLTPADSHKHEGEGLHTIILGNVASISKSTIDLYADTAESYKLPSSSRLSLLQKIRIATAMPSPAERRRLLIIRLLAIAVAIPQTSESSMQARLFILEPELVPQIADLVHPDRTVTSDVRTAALYALEGMLRLRQKASEVMNAVNVSVNHGILMGILRKLISDLDMDKRKFLYLNYKVKLCRYEVYFKAAFSHEFVDALFTFLTSVQADQTGSSMLTNAGVVPLLVQLIRNARQENYRVVTRAITTLDALSYGYTPASTAFLTNQGMSVFVEKVKASIEVAVARAESPKTSVDQDHSQGQITLPEATLLKALLRSIVRIMTSSGTQGEGLRNLIDSTLPLSLKNIMQHRKVFGPQIYALALNIMTTFIHNEPTSLSVVQEQGLPAAFYASVEDGIDPSFDVFSAIPNAIGALCLNDAGRDQFNSNNVIPKLFAVFTTEKHAKMLHERENASMIGAAIDELIRHHPTLKEPVMNSIVDMLRRILEIGRDYVPPSESVEMLEIAKGAEAEGTAADAVLSDVIMEESFTNETLETGRQGAPSSETNGKEEEMSRKDRDKDNLVLGYIDAAGRVSVSPITHTDLHFGFSFWKVSSLINLIHEIL